MYSNPRVFAALTIIAMTSPFSACGETPSGASASPAGALLDGGATFGSGSRITQDGGEVTTAADSGSTDQRSGVGFGSGN
jgi:hypothetical protein